MTLKYTCTCITLWCDSAYMTLRDIRNSSYILGHPTTVGRALCFTVVLFLTVTLSLQPARRRRTKSISQVGSCVALGKFAQIFSHHPLISAATEKLRNLASIFDQCSCIWVALVLQWRNMTLWEIWSMLGASRLEDAICTPRLRLPVTLVTATATCL